MDGRSNTAVAALVLYGILGITAFGWRSYRQWRRTGSTGMRGFHGSPGSWEWLAGAGFVVAIAVGVAAPVLQIAGFVSPVDVLDHRAVGLLGACVAVFGIAGTLWAQQAMGDSWRIGVDTNEATQLVDGGVFRWVRNPIFTAMLVFGVGVALMAPNVVTLLGFCLLFVSIELQVRVVEEPYLRATHGRRYLGYAAQAGRFVPGIGRMKGAASSRV